jgi:hypothetical protein
MFLIIQLSFFDKAYVLIFLVVARATDVYIIPLVLEKTQYTTLVIFQGRSSTLSTSTSRGYDYLCSVYGSIGKIERSQGVKYVLYKPSLNCVSTVREH